MKSRYGPDIIRGSDGKFYVCEDNLGYVGGMGDLLCARDTLLRGFPELRRAIDNSNPESFYRNIADDYKSKLGPNEVVVILHYPKWMTADNEEKRLVKIFAKYDFYSVVLPLPSFMNPKRKPRSYLSVPKSGDAVTLHVKADNGKYETKKVGLIFITPLCFLFVLKLEFLNL